MKALKNSLIVLVFILGVFAVIGSGGGGSDSDGGSSNPSPPPCEQPYVADVYDDGYYVTVEVANPGRNIDGADVVLSTDYCGSYYYTLPSTTANPDYFDIDIKHGCGYHYLEVCLYYCGTVICEYASSPYPFSVNSMSSNSDKVDWEITSEDLIGSNTDMAPMSENDELDWLSE